jgi:hypothetical protein
MKAALFLCVAGALAVAPPTIELDLGKLTNRATNGGVQAGLAHEVSDWQAQDHAVQHRPDNDYQRADGVAGDTIEQRSAPTTKVHVIKLEQPIWREHNENLVQPGGAPVKSRQDITIRCAVCESNCGSYQNTCKLPMARAYEHVGAGGEESRREVPVRKSLWRVDFQKPSDLAAGLSKSTTQEHRMTSINWTKRSTYLIKYDATDYAGNHAEQVVVAVILDDLNPPQITMCNGSSERVEGGNGWHLCATTTAYDQIDGDVTDRIRVSVERQVGSSWVETKWTQNCKQTDANGCTQVWKVKPQHVNGDADHDDELTTEPLSDRQPGTFRVTYYVQDKAGIYGTNYQNNFVTSQKIVTVEDDKPPVIEVQGVSPYTLECTHKYVDTGAEVSDQLDTLNLPSPLNYNAAGPADCTAGGSCTCGNAGECNGWENGVNIQPQTVPRTYTITYNAVDSNGNNAVTQTRQVYVRDTTAPIVQLNADDATPHAANMGKKSPLVYRTNSAHSPDKIKAHSPHENTWTDHFDPGATCADACDRTVTDSTITMSWGSKPFVDNVLGKYTRTYTCCDRSNNCASVEREFIVEDKEVPEITVTGTNPLYLEAQHNKDYADAGATCSDYVDNQLDSAVRASGDLVQMAVPGSYVIKYDCTDLSGNNAVQQSRTVIVQDTTCPQIKVNGAVINYLESGFPFVDELPAGFATAYDTLDGDITHKITSNGDSVTTASTFYQRRSCGDIKHFYQNAHTSEYYITRLVRNGHYERVLVWCDMANSGDTYYLVSNGNRVTNPYAGNADTNEKSSCPDHGLKLMTIDFTTEWEKTAWYTRVTAQFPSWTAGGVTGSTNMYLCVEDKSGQDGKDSAEQRRRHALTNAQMGKYVIQYTVEDAHGNRNDCDDNQPGRDCNQACSDLSSGKCTAKALCDAGQKDYCLSCKAENARRTVIVKDDLPTVTKFSDKDTTQLPFGKTAQAMMAETRASSADAWLVGAAAAAVAGVALLAMARGKETVTSVPV